jgi:hypothetical protein
VTRVSSSAPQGKATTLEQAPVSSGTSGQKRCTCVVRICLPSSHASPDPYPLKFSFGELREYDITRYPVLYRIRVHAATVDCQARSVSTLARLLYGIGLCSSLPIRARARYTARGPAHR